MATFKEAVPGKAKMPTRVHTAHSVLTRWRGGNGPIAEYSCLEGGWSATVEFMFGHYFIVACQGGAHLIGTEVFEYPSKEEGESETSNTTTSER